MLGLIAFTLAAAPFDTKADFGALAREHCRREWPADFQMREYCLAQQTRGMQKFKLANDLIGKPLERALERCVEDWTTNRLPNWQMIGHCAEEQARAFERINAQTP